jgi:hypothetical protein
VRPFLSFQRRTFFMPRVREKLRKGLASFIIISSLTSCVSAKYKMAGEETPPPVPLNLRAEARSVDALIDTVIVYGGPGSWKREAYWDEYLLLITNYGEHSVALTSATLIDFQGNPVAVGNEPWELQEQSKTWIENYDSGTTGVVLKVGAASVVTGAAVGGIALAVGGAASFAGPSGAAMAAAAAPVVALVALPIIGFGAILVNVEGKLKIEEEFHRRRLILPATIEPGQVTQGSLFFRITPGPQRLTLLFTGAETDFDVSVDLTPLSDLHIDTMPEPKQAE